MSVLSNALTSSDAREGEAATMIPVYDQLPFVPVRGDGCNLITEDGRRILDLYGGHAVAALGYGHRRLVDAISRQTGTLLFQSNAVALDVRATAAERLLAVAPANLGRVFFVNSGAEANENALRIACIATDRQKVLAVTHGFHGRTAAAGAVTWQSDNWYGFPNKPFDVDFIPRNDADAARRMIDDTVAAVIVEPIQGVAGAFDLSHAFLHSLRDCTARADALLIADEVQTGMGRSGQFFAMDDIGIEPDILTSAKALAGGLPCGAVLCTEELAVQFGTGDLGSTFGGGPIAAAAIVAVIDTIEDEGLLGNVREREAQIREQCLVGPVRSIQGKGLLLGLVCDRPAIDVRDALLDNDILTGASADPNVLRILAPLVMRSTHVDRLARTLASLAPRNT